MSDSLGTFAPAVSVVVLTWNRRELLAETLESILAQSYENYEVLVVDNESTDDTEEYVTSLDDPRVRYLCHANGGNLSVNRNYAVRRARGAWIAFCDDDDLWEPDKLEKQMEHAGAHPQAELISTNAVQFDEDREYGLLVESGGDRVLELDDFFAPRNPVMLSSVMVSRGLIEDVGPFDEDPTVFTIEDAQLWIKAAARGYELRLLDQPLLRYRTHGAMTSHGDSRVTIDKEIEMLANLREEGYIDDAAYERGADAFQEKRRRAGFKEGLKRVPGMKRLVYANRARSARKQEEDQ